MFTQPSAKDLSPERRGTVDKLGSQLVQAYVYQTDQPRQCYSNSDSQSGEAETSTKGTFSSKIQLLYKFQELFSNFK